MLKKEKGKQMVDRRRGLQKGPRKGPPKGPRKGPRKGPIKGQRNDPKEGLRKHFFINYIPFFWE